MEIYIKDGDIITRVNGKPINGPEAIFTLFQTLKDSDTFKIEIKRNGKTIVNTYKKVK